MNEIMFMYSNMDLQIIFKVVQINILENAQLYLIIITRFKKKLIFKFIFIFLFKLFCLLIVHLFLMYLELNNIKIYKSIHDSFHI